MDDDGARSGVAGALRPGRFGRTSPGCSVGPSQLPRYPACGVLAGPSNGSAAARTRDGRPPGIDPATDRPSRGREGTTPERYGTVYSATSLSATRNVPRAVWRITWTRNQYVVPGWRSERTVLVVDFVPIPTIPSWSPK